MPEALLSSSEHGGEDATLLCVREYVATGKYESAKPRAGGSVRGGRTAGRPGDWGRAAEKPGYRTAELCTLPETSSSSLPLFALHLLPTLCYLL